MYVKRSSVVESEIAFYMTDTSSYYFNGHNPVHRIMRDVPYIFYDTALSSFLGETTVDSQDLDLRWPIFNGYHPGAKAYFNKGKFFHTLNSFLSNWDTFAGGVSDKETPCIHRGIRGDVQETPMHLYMTNETTECITSLTPLVNPVDAYHPLKTYQRANIPGFMARRSPLEELAWIKSNLGFNSATSVRDPGNVLADVFGLKYDIQPHYIYFMYAVHWRWQTMSATTLCSSYIRPNFGGPVSYGVPRGNSYSLESWHSCGFWNIDYSHGWDYDVFNPAWYTWFEYQPMEPVPGWAAWDSYRVFLGKRFHCFNSMRSDFVSRLFDDSNADSFTTFINVADGRVADAHALAVLAAKDAIDTIKGNSSLNLIESRDELMEVSSISSSIGLGASLAKIGLNVQGPSLIFKILKVLASANLMYSFGLSPTSEDIKSLKRLVPKVQGLVESFSAGHVAYGKHTHLFDDMSLTTRLTLHYNVNPDGLLPMLLPLSILGSYPDLSTLWATIPFSFVADWFVNTGRSLAVVDSQIFILGMNPTYSVITNLFIKKIDNLIDSDPYVVRMASGGEAQFRYFIRSPFYGYPNIVPSPLLSQSLFTGNIPSWDIPLSLVVSLA